MTSSIQYSASSESTLPDKLLNFLLAHTEVQKITVPKGVSVCQSGDVCESLVILLDGRVKVFRPSENGQSLTLYYVNDHESCILTASCILNGMPFPAFAQTMKESTALSIPPNKVIEWMDEEPLWREYIFSLLSQRMVGLIELVNALAFQGLESRLAGWLIDQTKYVQVINVTHQTIAQELASSREVVSRLLKEFEMRGSIELSRGEVRVLDKEELNTY